MVCSEGEVSGPFASGSIVQQAITRQLERDLGRLKELLERKYVENSLPAVPLTLWM